MTTKRRKRKPGDMLLAAMRDGFRCHICGGGPDPSDPWRIDHDQALANGGSNSYENRKLAHESCNLLKGAK